MADGAAALSGHAAPSSMVRLVSTFGDRIQTTADGSGAWTARLGLVTEPARYSLTAETGGRTVEAEGYVAILPGAPTVALLRAGAGAQVQAAGSADIRILAVDMDAVGAAVVSGQAQPGASVRVMVDGGSAIQGAAGADGRFSLTLPKPLARGQRRVQVLAPKESAQIDIDVAPPAPLGDGPFQATSDRFGWRLNWLTPGGAPQTTLLIGAAGQRE